MADDWGVDVDVAETKARLQAFASQILDLRSFWPRVVPLFIGWEAQQFKTEGAYWGTPWAPLSPEYALRKAALHPGKGILVADGDLRREASTPSRRATPQTLTLTIRWRKRKGRRRVLDPGWHMLGTDRMPARPLLGSVLPLEAERELDAAAEEHIEDLARRTGLL